MKPRIHAYVLAGDEAFLAASLSSYAPIVERIFVSYDLDNLGWGGHPLPMEPSLRVAQASDAAAKVTLLGGRWSNPGLQLLECDTAQRRHAVGVAGEGADWVLQLDADEVVPDPRALVSALEQADAGGYDALDYPARWLYAKLGRERALESSRRFWGPAANYPGPIAVRSGTELTLCRQTRAATFRVDFAGVNTDPCHPRDAPVHRVVPVEQGILHYAWARSPEQLRRKAEYSGHARDFDWAEALRHWEWRRRHPRLAAAATPLRRPGDRQWFRVSRVPRTVETSVPSVELSTG